MSDQMALIGEADGFSLQLATHVERPSTSCPGRRVVDGACSVCHAPAADGTLGRHHPGPVVQGSLL